MILGIVFDLGDTLVTQEPLIGSAACHEGADAILPVISEYGHLTPSREQLADLIGERLQEAVVQAYQGSLAQPEADLIFLQALREFECELPPDLARPTLDRFFEPFYQRMEPIGEIVSTLTFARGLGLQLGLIANILWGEDLLRARLVKLGIANFMSATLLSSEIGWMKPYPTTFREIVRRLQLEPSQVVMVGDDPVVDIDGARRAGLKTVWKRSHPDQTAAPGMQPDLVIDDIRQILPAIAELMV